MLASKVGVVGMVETLDISAQNTTVNSLRPLSCGWYTSKIEMSLYMRLSDVGSCVEEEVRYLHVAFKEC
jgi:hypothetical protein